MNLQTYLLFGLYFTSLFSLSGQKSETEKVIVFENNGNGRSVSHATDQGKESHLGTKLFDRHGHGDLDIVGIAWRGPEFLRLSRNDEIKSSRTHKLLTTPPNRRFYVPITVDGNGFLRTNKPVDVQLDLISLLANAGLKTEFSERSMLLAEVNPAGVVINNHVPFQFEKTGNYDSSNKALGSLVFIMPGKTLPDQKRHFKLYFDDQVHNEHLPNKLVSLEHIGVYEGFDAIKIKTPTAEYYYHTATGGFASIKDREGHDWVSYHPNKEPETGMKGRFRGIPNIAPPELHPGETVPKKSTRIISEGPVRVSFLTETEDKNWQTKWDIYPEYATMTLLKKGTEPYWILYEGTPGGEFNEQDYWVRSDGTREIMKPYVLKNQWTGHLPYPKWVYFGDHKSERVLFYIHHEDYPHEDVFWHSGEGNMTVFGFGRGPSQDNWQQLTKAPAHLTLGFSEASDFTYVRECINASYKALSTSVGHVIENDNK